MPSRRGAPVSRGDASLPCSDEAESVGERAGPDEPDRPGEGPAEHGHPPRTGGSAPEAEAEAEADAEAQAGHGAVGVRSAWHDVPRPQVRRFAAIALAEAPDLAEEILREIRREYPNLPLVVDDSGEPMALVGIRRAIEVFVQHLETAEGRPRVHPEVFQEFGRGEDCTGAASTRFRRSTGWASASPGAGSRRSGSGSRSRRRRCTSSSTRDTSTWTVWWINPYGVTPRPPPGRRGSACASSAV